MSSDRFQYLQNKFLFNLRCHSTRDEQSGPGPAGTGTKFFFDWDRDQNFFLDRDHDQNIFDWDRHQNLFLRDRDRDQNFFSHRDRDQKWLVPLMSTLNSPRPSISQLRSKQKRNGATLWPYEKFFNIYSIVIRFNINSSSIL